jgi:hypothetical protein
MVRSRAVDGLSKATQEVGSVRKVSEGVMGSEMRELFLKPKRCSDVASLEGQGRVTADDLYVEGSGVAVDIERNLSSPPRTGSRKHRTGHLLANEMGQ